MHTTRRVFVRLMNFRDDFNLFTKHGIFGSNRRSLILKKNDAASSWNILTEDSIRNSVSSYIFTRNFSILPKDRQEPPEPKGLPIVGTLLSIIMAGGAKKLHEYINKRHQELGPVFREQIGPVRGVFVSSPDEYRKILIEFAGPTPQHFIPEAWKLYNKLKGETRGLLFMDGEEWWQYRKILNKAMLKPHPKMFLCTSCQEVAENLVKRWKTYTQIGGTIPNLNHEMYQWSIEVMLAIMIGSRWQDIRPQMHSEIEDIAMMVHEIFIRSITLSMIPPKLAMKLQLPVWNKFVKTNDAVLNKVHNLVPQILKYNNDGLLKKFLSDGISIDKAANIITDFIIAAGDTTSVSMQWVLLLLSSRPDLQDQLFHDIKDLPLDDLLQHQLLRNASKEAMRLYPVAPFIGRYLPMDAVIGGYFVPKGHLILLSIYTSSRDEQYFPRPNDFWPERWLRNGENSLEYQGVKDARASVPFAAGLRGCIGRKLAETQLTLTLAQLIKNFKIECENRDSIEMILHLISVPSELIKLKLTNRET